MKPENLELEELIEKYFDKEFVAEELAAFEKRLESDPAFAKEVELHRLTKQVSKLYEPIYFKNLLLERGQQKTRKRRQRIIYLRRIAAAVLLLLVVGGYFHLDNNFSDEGIRNEYFKPYSSTNNKGNSQPGEQSNYKLAIQAYNNSEYEDAIALFLVVPDSNRTNQFYMYLSSALLAVDSKNLHLNENNLIASNDSIKYHPAVPYLQRLKEFEEYREDAQWYLALAYLRSGYPELAKKELEIIISKNSGYKSEAEKMLQKLNSPWRKIFH